MINSDVEVGADTIAPLIDVLDHMSRIAASRRRA
jgi:hypothetical protein